MTVLPERQMIRDLGRVKPWQADAAAMILRDGRALVETRHSVQKWGLVTKS